MKSLALLPALALALAACDGNPAETPRTSTEFDAPLFSTIPDAACPGDQTLVEATGFESEDKNGDGWICGSTNGAGKVLYGDNNVNSSPGEIPIEQLPPEAANGILHSCLDPASYYLLPVQPGYNCSALCQDVQTSRCTVQDCEQLCEVAGGVICTDPPSGLISWWPGDGDATDIVDGNDGALLAGEFDGAIGTGVLIGDQANLESLSQITIDAWVRTTDPAGDRGIITKHFAGQASWVLRTEWRSEEGKMSFGVETEDGTTVTSNELGSTTSIADGAFHHVAGSYDGSTVKLYVDGVLEDFALLSGTIKNTVNQVVIGNYNGYASWPAFDGVIDEVEIFDRALSAEEIMAIYDAGSAARCKP